MFYFSIIFPQNEAGPLVPQLFVTFIEIISLVLIPFRLILIYNASLVQSANFNLVINQMNKKIPSIYPVNNSDLANSYTMYSFCAYLLAGEWYQGEENGFNEHFCLKKFLGKKFLLMMNSWTDFFSLINFWFFPFYSGILLLLDCSVFTLQVSKGRPISKKK